MLSMSTRFLNDEKYTYEYFTRRNVCRLCWRICMNTCPIALQNDASLTQFVTEHIGLSVKGHILQTVCGLCADTINSFINYKKLCHEADQKLTNILNSGRTKENRNVGDLSTEPLACKVKVSETKSESTKIKEVSKIKLTQSEPDILLSPSIEYNENKIQKTESEIKPKKRKYRCRLCVEIYHTLRAFNEHRYKHHPDTAPKFICEICGKVLRTKWGLNSHNMLIHSDQKFKCPQCDLCFKVPSEISTHIRRVHKRERNFACHLCPQRCFNAFNLNVHLKRHYGIKNYQCHICPKKYVDEKSLKNHISVTHECLVGQYKCTYCSSIYINVKQLRNHMLKVHGKKIKACKGSFTVVDESS